MVVHGELFERSQMMFIPGVIFIIIGIVLVISARGIKKTAAQQGRSVGLVGSIGIVLGIVLIVASGIRIIGPGEVGVLSLYGKVMDKEIDSGVNLVNPLMSVHTFSVKTREMKETMMVPSQEGLQVELDVSILYRMNFEDASEIFRTIGPDYEDIVILPTFRSAVRDVSVNYDARDLYTSGREIIEKSLTDALEASLRTRGFILEKVLFRSVTLPPMVAQAIEEKLKADQEAQKMTFVLQKEQMEMERKKIEAEGIKEANRIISESLTSNYIRWYRIEMLKELVNSPNNTIIIIPEDLESVPMIMNK